MLRRYLTIIIIIKLIALHAAAYTLHPLTPILKPRLTYVFWVWWKWIVSSVQPGMCVYETPQWLPISGLGYAATASQPCATASPDFKVLKKVCGQVASLRIWLVFSVDFFPTLPYSSFLISSLSTRRKGINHFFSLLVSLPERLNEEKNRRELRGKLRNQSG